MNFLPPNPYRVFFTVLLISTCAFSTVFFEEDFEYGLTFTDKYLDSGAMEIPLRINDALSGWNKKGGIGLLENDNPVRRDYFTYSGIQRNALVGVKGVDFRHPEGVEAVSNGCGRWDKADLTNLSNDSLSGINGGFGIRYNGWRPDGGHLTVYRTGILRKYFIRFFLQVDTLSDKNESPPFLRALVRIFFTGLDKQDGRKNDAYLIMINVVQDRDGKYFLRIFFGDTPLFIPYEIRLHDKLFIECVLSFEKENLVLSVYINEKEIVSKREECRYSDKSELGLSLFPGGSQPNFSSSGDWDVRMDDFRCSDRRLGRPYTGHVLNIRRNDKPVDWDSKQDANNSSYQISTAETKPLELQFQVSRDYDWGLPLILRTFDQFVFRNDFKYLNFPSGRLVVRSRMKEKGFDWSPWQIQPLEINEDAEERRPVVDSIVLMPGSHEFLMRGDTIQAGGFYTLLFYSHDPLGMHNKFYNAILLSHSDFLEGDALNKGGVFTKDQGYYISLSKTSENKRVVYVKEGIGKSNTMVLNGGKESYVDFNHQPFDEDTVSGCWRTNFRLDRLAKPGTWFIKGVMFNKQEIPSVTFVKKVVVLPGKRYWWERYERMLWFGLAVIGFALIAFFSILFKKLFLSTRIKTLKIKSLPPTVMEIKNPDYRMKMILDNINENYTKDISLKELSEKFNLHPNTIGNSFKAQIGVSLSNYLNTLRCDKAKELLKDPALAVKDISIRVGYNSEDYFCKIFKQITGLTPKDYRKTL